jgi:(p)ppGpp synthase/HD superfamily hydrolase
MTWDQDQYVRALRFAAAAHDGQTITGTTLPYIVHAATVAMEVIAAIAAGGASDANLAVQCALLHDVVEDTSVTRDGIEAAFGPAVAAGVAALSKDAALPKPDAMRDSLARIRQQPHEVWIVKLADRISNLMPPPAHWTPERCAAYRDEAQLILDTLGAASPLLAARLAGKIAAY